MSSSQPITITFDRRILEHPRAYHLRRMRAGLWLYLDLLARLPAGAETIEVEPAAIGRDMGLPEGTVRSWLGHLRKAGYLEAVRLNGSVRVRVKRAEASAAPVPGGVQAEKPARFFTVPKVQRALGESGNEETIQAALGLYPDSVIQRALVGTLAVPESQIRRSRTALFIYLLKRHAKET